MNKALKHFLGTLFLIAASLFLIVPSAEGKNTLSQDGRAALKVLTQNRQAVTIGLNAQEGVLREIKNTALCYWRVFEGSPAQLPGVTNKQMNQDLAADIFALSATNALAVKRTSQFSYWSQGSLTRAAKQRIDNPRIRGLLLAQVSLIKTWRALSEKQVPVCQILQDWKENNYQGIMRLVDNFLGQGELQKIVDVYWDSVQATFSGAYLIEENFSRAFPGLYLSVYARSENTYNRAWRYVKKS